QDTITFSGDGTLKNRADLRGNTVGYGTDIDGRVTEISGSGGRSLTLSWDGAHVTSVTDSAGRAVTYGYDTAGNLVEYTAADGRVTEYGHDANHRVTTVEAPDGGIVTNVYDGAGRVLSQTDEVNRTTSFAYTLSGGNQTTTVTNPAGVDTDYDYVDGVLREVTAAVGTPREATTSYSYNAALDLLSTTDPLGNE